MTDEERRPAPAASGGSGNGSARQPSHHCSTSPIETLLPRLDRVKRQGDGRWLACCPAHGDRSPSLSIRETADGTLLVHCFAGCPAADIVAAVGLELRDLFPDNLAERGPLRKGERHVPKDALAAVATESRIAAMAADDLARGETLSDTDHERLKTASIRLHNAAKEVGA